MTEKPYKCGKHLEVLKTSSGRWTVRHVDSGSGVTGGRTFTMRRAAMAYGRRLQELLDFHALAPDHTGKWDAVATFGAAAIRHAMDEAVKASGESR